MENGLNEDNSRIRDTSLEVTADSRLRTMVTWTRVVVVEVETSEWI